MPFLIAPSSKEGYDSLNNKYKKIINDRQLFALPPYGRIVACNIFNNWRRTHHARTHPAVPILGVDFGNDFHVIEFFKADVQDLIDKASPTQFIGAFFGCSFTPAGGGRFNKTTVFLGITNKTVIPGQPDKYEFAAGQPVYEGNASSAGTSVSGTNKLKESRDFYIRMIKKLQNHPNSGFSAKEMTGVHHELGDFKNNFFDIIPQTNPRTGKIKAIFMKDTDLTNDRTTIVYADENQAFDPALDITCPPAGTPQPIIFDFGTGCCQI